MGLLSPAGAAGVLLLLGVLLLGLLGVLLLGVLGALAAGSAGLSLLQCSENHT